MYFFYNLFIHLYQVLIKISSLFKTKARLWCIGRRDIFYHLSRTIQKDQPIVWFHCASLGEFEQGRPVIEAFRKQFPGVRILLTFFSPSGYEIRKNYPGADYIFYLPADTGKNASRFIHIVKPSLAVFIKYEYWFNYMRVLKSENIPLVYISAIFRPGQRFFRPWGKWQLSRLKTVSHFFVQNDESAQLLKKAGINQVTVSGDTRFDRVLSIAKRKKDFPLIARFCENNPILLAGSTWPPDEELIISLANEKMTDLKVIFAPHEVHPERIKSLIKKIKLSSLKFSEASPENIYQAQVLIIDSIGILSHLYQYATIAYIGGGFGTGIHNILEAATFGKPVIFGPNYHKFQEAVDLVNLGGAFSMSTETELHQLIKHLLANKIQLQKSSETARRYVSEKCGATSIILTFLAKYFPEY